jgi:Domain of unknown function (DUF4145)
MTNNLIEFRISLGDEAWDQTIRGWTSEVFSMPGVAIEQIFHDGCIASTSDWELSRNTIRWISSTHPSRIVVALRLAEERTELERQKLSLERQKNEIETQTIGRANREWPLRLFFAIKQLIKVPGREKEAIQDLKIPDPHELMPDEIKALYEEARQVFSISKRSSAALLRLVIQELCTMSGGEGNIYKDIQKLVDDGLQVHVQQALDIIRIVGNSAVHAGEIDLSDETARSLFGLVNDIVDELIAKPKKQAQISEQYGKLPETKKRKL